MENYTRHTLEVNSIELIERFQNMEFEFELFEREHSATFLVRDVDDWTFHAIITIVDDDSDIAIVDCTQCFLEKMQELGITEEE